MVTTTTDYTSEMPSTPSSDTCESVMPHFEKCTSPVSYATSTNRSSEPTENEGTKTYQNFLTLVEVLAEIPDSSMDVLGIQLDNLVLDCQVAGQQCSQW